MSVRHAVGLPNVGVFGSVPALVELAVLAEHSGWDGVHLWDHLLYHDPEWPVASPVATAAAVAAATQRVRIVLTLTLPRRQVQDVAQDTAGIAALASGRLTVLGIIGSMDREFTEFGLDPDLKARGRALDERLACRRNCGGNGVRRRSHSGVAAGGRAKRDCVGRPASTAYSSPSRTSGTRRCR